jgi:hypothetical protein
MRVDLSKLSDDSLLTLERRGSELRDRTLRDFLDVGYLELAALALDVDRYAARFRNELVARLNDDLDGLAD